MCRQRCGRPGALCLRPTAPQSDRAHTPAHPPRRKTELSHAHEHARTLHAQEVQAARDKAAEAIAATQDGALDTLRENQRLLGEVAAARERLRVLEEEADARRRALEEERLATGKKLEELHDDKMRETQLLREEMMQVALSVRICAACVYVRGRKRVCGCVRGCPPTPSLLPPVSETRIDGLHRWSSSCSAS